MAHSPRIASLIFFASLIAGCSPEPSPLEIIAHQLSDAASRCVVDVRDRRVKYEDSENCRSLGRSAHQYISAGGLRIVFGCVLTVLLRAREQKLGWRLPFPKPATPAL